MASPVTVGDALLLSKFAYKLARGLTSDMNGVPQVFKELKSQVEAVGNALNMCWLRYERSTPSSREPEGNLGILESEPTITAMIANCQTCLKRLEALVEKYDILDQEPSSSITSSPSFVAKLKRSTTGQYKRIRFLMKDAELKAIRNDLGVHLASINLAISGTPPRKNLSEENELCEQVSDTHKRVKDLHDWFMINLRSSSPQETVPSLETISVEEAATGRDPQVYSVVTFKVQQGGDILCPRAAFRKDWTQAGFDAQSPGIWECWCDKRQESNDSNHKVGLRRTLVDDSILIRLSGLTPMWQLLCATTRVRPIIISDVNPLDLSQFYKEIDELLFAQLHRPQSTPNSMIISKKVREDGPNYGSVLDAKRLLDAFRGKITMACFTCKGQSFMHRSIGSAHLLHYRTMMFEERFLDKEEQPNIAQHSPYAELILRPSISIQDNSPLYYSICIVEGTQVLIEADSETIVLPNVSAQAKRKDGRTDRISKSTLELSFMSNDLAIAFRRCIQDIQTDLKIIRMKCAMLGETVVFRRLCGNIVIKDFFMANASMSLVFDTFTLSHRLIVLSASQATCMSVELPSTFFENLGSEDAVAKLPALRASFIEHKIDKMEVIENVSIPLSTVLRSHPSKHRMLE